MAGCFRKIFNSGGQNCIFYLPSWLKTSSCLTPSLTALSRYEKSSPFLSVQPFTKSRHFPRTARKKRRLDELLPPHLPPVGPEDYHRWRHYLRPTKTVVEPPAVSAEDIQISDEIFYNVNKQIESDTYGRLFAIVHVAGKQFKITTHDMIVIQGVFPPANGDVIRLEKVLMVAGSDFTLIGRPLLNKDLVNIEATVMEKTLSQVVTRFRFKRRKQFRRINFYRFPYTMLRINDIRMTGKVNEVKDVEGLDGRVIS